MDGMEERDNPIAESGDGGEQGHEDLQENKGESAEESRASEGGEAPGEGEHQEKAGDADRQRAEQKRFNDAMKAARHRAEKETEERMKRGQDQRIAGLRIPNPNKPGEYFANMKDLEEYSSSLKRANAEERARREKRPVAEILEEDANREYLRRKREEEESARAAKDDKKAKADFIAADVADFRTRYPDVDIAKLDANRSFRRFAGSRYGVEPLADLYEDYLEITGTAEKSGAAKAADKIERSTGGSSGQGGPVLSAAERQRLEEWNRQNPDMKMTEKEFFEREG